MTRRRTWHWVAAASLLAVACVLQARPAEALKKIQVFVINSNHPSCSTDGQGNNYVGEAQGRAFNTTVHCEAITTGGTAMASCPEFGGDQHRTRIIKRNSSFNVVGSELMGGPTWHAWNTDSSPVSYNIPAAGSCPGATISAVSRTRF